MQLLFSALWGSNIGAQVVFLVESLKKLKRTKQYITPLSKKVKKGPLCFMVVCFILYLKIRFNDTKAEAQAFCSSSANLLDDMGAV